MNNRHPSEDSSLTGHVPDASYGLHAPYEQQGIPSAHAAYDGYATGTFDNLGAAYGHGDPLFGEMPGSYGTGAFAYPADQVPDAGQWHNGAQGTDGYGIAYSAQPTTYDTGMYDSGQYDASQWAGADHGLAQGIPAPSAPHPLETTYGTGDWSPAGWTDPAGSGPYDAGLYDTGQHPTGSYTMDQHNPMDQHTPVDQHNSGQWNTGQWAEAAGPESWDGADATQLWDAEQTQAWNAADAAQAWESGQPQPWDATGPTADGTPAGAEAYDAYGRPAGTDTEHSTAFDATAAFEAVDPAAFEAVDAAEFAAMETAVFEAVEEPHGAEPAPGHDATAVHGMTAGTAADGRAGDEDEPAVALLPGPRRGGGGSARARRRMPARRSALLTVAVPSVAVMGVAGIAAASVSNSTPDESRTTQAAPDPAAVKPSAANNKMDTQLATLSADADDFADRASRTQERIDLKQRQLEEKKRKEAEAARREALRPKFAIPVEQHGLSATFGQAGVNWMSLHSGIDFPVSYGTPVMAATDGTVRTQYNLAYGNMAIVTAPDGTETWYCHLSSTKIRSGSVKAGDVIAFSGNSGNSTGPHLHFEVHPGGDDAVDPLPWLRSKGLDPN
ncbi:M23 family metallopeptidase [Streptomyces sp. NPDC001922]|uniref:M23 family metallopeptidase n=1 Tax=Streptomyces sp. NPDC001922 TaxID=3364624 RepID=UPI0036C12A2F